MKRFAAILGILVLELLRIIQPESVAAGTDGDSAAFSYVFSLPRRYVNDHSLIFQGGLWHLFYTDGDMTIRPWLDPGNEIVLSHATSPDLVNWTVAAPALQIGPKGSLDAAHLYAPNVIEANGTYYMFYTGNERSFLSGEHIFLATSSDLSTWKRYSSAPILLPDSGLVVHYPPGYDSGSGGPVSCRDPFLLKDSVYGYICYYVVRLKGDSTRPSVDQEFAGIAVATSPDLIHWTNRGTALIRRTVGYDATAYSHPESPCVIKKGSLYYLFWKGGAGTRYVISESPFDFHDRTEYFLSTSHASKIFQWKDEWYITSCSRAVNDVTHTLSDRTKGLYLARLDWPGHHPSIVPFAQTSSIDQHEGQSESKMYPNSIVPGQPVRLVLPQEAAAGDLVVTDPLGRETARITAADVRRMMVAGVVEVPTRDLRAGLYMVRAGSRGSIHKLLVR